MRLCAGRGGALMQIALILPEQRLWRWHARLVAELARRGSVEVRLAPGAPYPLALRAWLGLERRLFGPRGGAVPISLGELGAPAPVHDPGEALIADLVIDLAEAGSAAGAARVLTLRFDGQVQEAALLRALQARRSPRLEVVDGAGAVRAASYPAIEVHDELGRSLAYVFSRLVALLLRALEPSASPAVAPPPSDAGPGAGPSGGGLAVFAAYVMRTKLHAKLSGGRSVEEDWRVALRPAAATSLPPGAAAPFRPLARPPGAFQADPFLFAHEDRTYLFVEAYPWSTHKGVIACAEIGPDGRPGAFETVLEADHHLSYPQVFAWEGEVYMLPETASARRLELYRAQAFPHRWERSAILMEGVRIADATLLQHEGRWWLFASVAEHGGATQDEVFAWHGSSPLGPWTPHTLNPLVSDVRAGRPAGRFVRRCDRLFRPAQDGEAGYGSGLAWCEVEELTPASYRERVVDRWRGADFGPYTGVHTFSEGGGWEAIDLKSPRGQAP